MSDLTPTQPTRPWERRAEESPAEFVAFLAWCFSQPRAAQLPGSLHQTSIRFDWHRRAMLISKRLGDRLETPEQACAAIAQDSLVILRAELEHKAALALAQPGSVNMKELVALMRLLAELGGFAGAAPQAEPDYSSLTPDELQTLAQAGQILARTQPAAGAKR